MSKRLKVVILTEGGRNIGVGHITRCTSLYQAFDEKDITPEFIVNGDETVEDLLRDKRYENPPSPPFNKGGKGGFSGEILDWLKEQEYLFSLIKDADIVIIDSYLADYGFYKRVSEMVSVPVYMDDTMRMDYPEGIVINGSIGAEELDYKRKKGVIPLIGACYIPLRKGFWNVPEKGIKESVESVMVTFGGDDLRGMTPKVLKLLIETYPELTKNVVIGMGFQNIKEIEERVDKRTNLIYFPDAEGMKKIILESDIAISAGGQTLYELARVGVPSIGVAIADNQMNNVMGWQKAGFIEYAGWYEDRDLMNRISESLNRLMDASLRKDKANAGRKMVDGLGAVRITKFLTRKYIEKDLVLRPAEMKDMYPVYELSNEPGVRQNSFNEGTIGLEGHKNWFTDRLRDNNCLFLVAEVKDHFLGQIRFNINKDEAVISISIVKQYRGFGLGRILMKRALNLLRLRNPDIQRIKAYIKKGNASSIKFFEESNFQFVKKMFINNHDAFEYGYQFNEDIDGV